MHTYQQTAASWLPLRYKDGHVVIHSWKDGLQEEAGIGTGSRLGLIEQRVGGTGYPECVRKGTYGLWEDTSPWSHVLFQSMIECVSPMTSQS